jgi:L-type amino acid transporter 9
VYLLTNLAFYAGVTTDELLESKAIAVTFADKYYWIFAFLMPIMVACSCFGYV